MVAKKSRPGSRSGSSQANQSVFQNSAGRQSSFAVRLPSPPLPDAAQLGPNLSASADISEALQTGASLEAALWAAIGKAHHVAEDGTFEFAPEHRELPSPEDSARGQSVGDFAENH